LEEAVPDFTLITPNVDGLHALAGSKRVVEVHGSIWEVR
jgi:NAD-dependent deacetylase